MQKIEGVPALSRSYTQYLHICNYGVSEINNISYKQ